MEILRSLHSAHLRGARLKVKQKDRLPSDCDPGGGGQLSARGLFDREGDDDVAALGVDLGVAARTDDDILLAVDHV
jgi:hypothetical protein